MNRSAATVAMATCAVTIGSSSVRADEVAGIRAFPSTLLIGEPYAGDEISLPTISIQRQGASGELGPSWQYNVSVELEKRITENLGVSVATGYTIQTRRGDKTRTGFQNLGAGLKYQAWIDASHEAIVSLGLVREFGRTGTAHVGADEFGSTTPTVYFGKGLGDLPVPALRPFAITGTIGYSVADKKLKASFDPDPSPSGVTGVAARSFNNGLSNRWIGGLSLQYDLFYLKSQVRDFGLPDFVNKLTPLVDIAWSSPASKPSELGTQLVFAPGVIYQSKGYQFGIEALIPGNRASGRNVGVIAQLHLEFDDLFPSSLGKPFFGE